MIVIVDYGLGNIRSVSRAMEKLGAEVIVTSGLANVKKADGVVLPGVGAFRKAVKNIKDLGLWGYLKEYIEDSRPYLGICLGLQLLFTKSSEHGTTNGFDIIRGSVERLPEEVKIPHMGWNQVSYPSENTIFNNVKNNSFFYFDHSYYVIPDKKEVIAGVTEYGVKFPAVVKKGNIWGVQFHPEKSSNIGLELLRNFINNAS
ncbi:imidazole glycerol phosphate synthase subunit HisH [Elusimicrobiota bacterium]